MLWTTMTGGLQFWKEKHLLLWWFGFWISSGNTHVDFQAVNVSFYNGSDFVKGIFNGFIFIGRIRGIRAERKPVSGYSLLRPRC